MEIEITKKTNKHYWIKLQNELDRQKIIKESNDKKAQVELEYQQKKQEIEKKTFEVNCQWFRLAVSRFFYYLRGNK